MLHSSFSLSPLEGQLGAIRDKAAMDTHEQAFGWTEIPSSSGCLLQLFVLVTVAQTFPVSDDFDSSEDNGPGVL